MKKLSTAIRVTFPGSNGLWMTGPSQHENDRHFIFGLRPVSFDIYGMRSLITSHLCSSPYNGLLFRYRSPHVGNLSTQAFHLYGNLRLKTLAQTSVDVPQVLSRLYILLSTSREAHTSSTTMQELMEVSFFQEEYVRTEVLGRHRSTSISIRSFCFILLIHHLRPTINDAGPH